MYRIVFVIILSCLSFSAFAQKVAVIDESAVLNDLPEAKKIESELKELIKRWSDTATAYGKIIQERRDILKQQTTSMTPTERRNAIDTIGWMEQMLSKYTVAKQDPKTGELAQERRKRYGPTLEHYKAAINSVARSEKIDIVMNRTNGIYIGTATMDISDKVKKIMTSK